MTAPQTDAPSQPAQTPLDTLCINTIRTLAMDGVQKANSGHPGTPMGLAPVAYTLWTSFLKHNPVDPSWPDRDRFVLSCGHASMLLYSLLHLTGYDLPLEQLQQFRQWGSKTPGHPEHGLTPGVETTTGPLGQGFGNAVGMAIAERYLGEVFNRPGHTIVDHYTYGICSDGDLMEGISHEAASLAGHLGLGKLIFFYDDNHITIEGDTDLAFSEEVGHRFEAYGWHVQRVDGNNLPQIGEALKIARAETLRPSLIIARTHIAEGSPNKHDTAGAHGSPLGVDEVKLTKQNLGWPDKDFYVPDEALAHFRQAVERGKVAQADWQKRFEAYAAAHPDLAALWKTVMSGDLPEGWDAEMPVFKPEDPPIATRVSSGRVINAIAAKLPTLIGGAADLAPSTDTLMKGVADFGAQPGGRNMHFGIREHGMGAALNGMALHGGIIPFGATFLIFSDYMRPSMRLAALMEQRVIYVFTHDSIGLGEDGPTHQPVEQLSALRAIHNLTVIRPCDGNETAEAWRAALTRKDGPTALALTRQNLPHLDRSVYAPASGLHKGAYILADAPNGQPDVILLASGSEVSLITEAAKQLAARGVQARVVSVPSMEIFNRQPKEYQESVLPPTITERLAVEAAAPMSWYRYVGLDGAVVGIERFGASAPYKTLMEHYGLTVENVVAQALRMLGR
ncbi:MAG TPA: transketolase [Ktedonobacterales bacterium]|nr:transketolase [Ktedonobacterales bacterium]